MYSVSKAERKQRSKLLVECSVLRYATDFLDHVGAISNVYLLERSV